MSDMMKEAWAHIGAKIDAEMRWRNAPPVGLPSAKLPVNYQSDSGFLEALAQATVAAKLPGMEGKDARVHFSGGRFILDRHPLPVRRIPAELTLVESPSWAATWAASVTFREGRAVVKFPGGIEV